MGYDLVVAGGSWGGSAALRTVLSALPADFGVPVVIAQHRAADLDGVLARYLGDSGPLKVREIEDKDELRGGVVYLAPADYHVLVDRDQLALTIDAPVKHSRPSIDALFESAADTYGEHVVGVILTGASDDGADGIAHIKARGGYTIAQDPAEAERPTMPSAAIARGRVDEVLPVAAIGPRIVALCRAGAAL